MIYIVPYPMLLTLDFFCIKKEPLYLGERLLSIDRVHVHVTHDLTSVSNRVMNVCTQALQGF